MAGFNEILAGRFNRFVQKFVAIKGGPPAPTLAPEWMPSIPWELTAAELWLKSWDMFGAGFNNTGVAAVHSAAAVRNPKGSNIIAVFTSIHATTSANDCINLEYDNGGDLNTSVTTTTRLDARQGSLAGLGSGLILSRSNTVDPGAGSQADIKCVLAQTNVEFIVHEDDQIPLLPGDRLMIRNNTVALNLFVGIRWIQRVLEESERGGL